MVSILGEPGYCYTPQLRVRGEMLTVTDMWIFATM